MFKEEDGYKTVDGIIDSRTACETSAAFGKVYTIIRLRVNSDGTGVRSVIFFYNCPLSCQWCCNPETRFGSKYKELSVSQLYSLIERDWIYFKESGGGITFSGGEPLVHAEYIQQFMEKYSGKLCANIETSLYADIAVLDLLIPYIYEWYVDFKLFDEAAHIEYTGVSNKTIKANMVYLSEKIDTERIIITYPIIPGINDSDDNIRNMIGFMKQHNLHRVELHPYRKRSEKKYIKLGIEHDSIEPLSGQRLLYITKTFECSSIEVVVRDTCIERRKCDTLKSIRRDYCAKKNIPLTIDECSFQGRCVGTCPKCEWELDYINNWRKEYNA